MCVKAISYLSDKSYNLWKRTITFYLFLLSCVWHYPVFRIPVLIVNTDGTGHCKTAFSDCLLSSADVGNSYFILKSTQTRQRYSFPAYRPFFTSAPILKTPQLPCCNPVCGHILYNPEALIIPWGQFFCLWVSFRCQCKAIESTWTQIRAL